MKTSWLARLGRALKGTGDEVPEGREGEACPAGFGGGAQPPWALPGTGRVATVGYLLDTPKASFIWGDPRRVEHENVQRGHAKSVTYCPAVVDYEARHWDVPCPVDVRLGFRRDAQGKPSLVNLNGDKSPVRAKHLNQMIAIVAEKEWRNPDRPIIQFITPYIFLADEPVWMTQLPPISFYRNEPWPGVVIGGRLPIHIWPRPMMWAFEWWDTSKELNLKRGEPWFFLRFDTHDPTRHVRLKSAQMTPELREYLDGLSSVSNYVDQTFSLFKTAQERRPDRLFVERKRSAAPIGEGEG